MKRRIWRVDFLASRSHERASSLILPIVIVLSLATVAGVIALRGAFENFKGAIHQSDQELAKIEALDGLHQSASVLVDMINQTIAIHDPQSNPSDFVSGSFLHALGRAGKSLTDFRTAVQAAGIDHLVSLNKEDGLFKIFADDRNMSVDIRCQLNCNARADSYPKVFQILVVNERRKDKGLLTSLRVSAEIRQSILADFSTIASRVVDEEVWLGAGTHAGLALFWDLDHMKTGEPGNIRFVHRPDETFYASKIVTNTSAANIDYFTLLGGGHMGPTMIEAGDVQVPGGVLASANPVSEISQSVAEQITGAIQSGNEHVDQCELYLGCSGSTCTAELREFDLVTNDWVEVFPRASITSGDVFYSASTSGCRILRDPANDEPNEILIGSASATFIAKNGFELGMSVSHMPSLNEASRGLVVFAAQDTDAVRLHSGTQLLSGKTISETLSSGAGTYPNGVGLRIDAGLITSDDLSQAGEYVGARALGTQNVLNVPPSGSAPLFGKLVTSGPMYGSQTIMTRKVDSSGNIVAGFESMESTYGSRWMYNPPPILSIQTGSDHTIVFGSIVASWGDSLDEALASVGLEFIPGLLRPTDYAGTTGTAPTTTTNVNTADSSNVANTYSDLGSVASGVGEFGDMSGVGGLGDPGSLGLGP